jgi:hypothetical protein
MRLARRKLFRFIAYGLDRCSTLMSGMIVLVLSFVDPTVAPSFSDRHSSPHLTRTQFP